MRGKPGGSSLSPVTRTILKLVGLVALVVFLSSFALFATLDEEITHDVLSRTKVWKSELQNARLRSRGSVLFRRCTISEPVFFFSSSGGVNAAVELGASCPHDAFVILQRAPTLSEEDIVESLASPASELAAAVLGKSEWKRSSSVESLFVAHLSNQELAAAAAAEAKEGGTAGIAHFRTQLVVMRAGDYHPRQQQQQQNQPQQQHHVELCSTTPITLRVPVPSLYASPFAPSQAGDSTEGSSALRVALLSDSQSGTTVFRDLLGHIAQSGAIDSYQEEGLGGPFSSSSSRQQQYHTTRGVTTAVFSWASYYLSRRSSGSKGSSNNKKGNNNTEGDQILRPEGPSRPLDFLIHGGDTLQSPSPPESTREAFMYFLSPLADFYSQWGPTGLADDGLHYAVPVLLIRGNHDCSTRHAAYTTDPQLWPKQATTGEPNARLPPSYFELQFGSALRLIVTDTSEESQEQLQWLQGTVCREHRSVATVPTLAFSHVPPWVEYWEKEAWDTRGEDRWSDYSRQKLLPILMAKTKQRPVAVDALVSGHAHLYQRGSVDRKKAGGAHLCPGVMADQSEDSKAAIVLATVGGGGGALENNEQGGGKVQETGLFSVTSFSHQFVLLEAAANAGTMADDKAGVEAAADFKWLARARDGTTIDSFALQKKKRRDEKRL